MSVFGCCIGYDDASFVYFPLVFLRSDGRSCFTSSYSWVTGTALLCYWSEV